ncbi:MAG TPA: RHS repeat-associated core domain-containing protein, partial [Gemmataceae bacterium]|nr:RHS repeat-associated core domain-containing protein [Gemmataceae bacterium]
TLGANVTFHYDIADRLDGATRKEGTSGSTITSAYSYDNADRLTEIDYNSSSTGHLSTFTYGYDPSGRVTSYTGPQGSRAYTYDNTDQLTTVTNGGSTVLESFAYDANGNRTSAGGVSYSTSTGNRLTSDGYYSYTYDNEGNTLTKSQPGDYWQYSYDDRNRLTEAQELTGAGGTVVYDAQYTYDVFNRRIGVHEDENPAGLGNGTDTVTQLWTAYDRQNAWADYNGSGSLTMRYLNGQGMDERFARVTAGGTVGWYLTDDVNSVRQIVQTNGTVVYAASYTAFGTIASQTGTGGDRFKFTGREWDAGTGQYYYRARYYGPSIGQFRKQDPVGFRTGDTNLYRYVANQPILNSDPLGLWRVNIHLVAGEGFVTALDFSFGTGGIELETGVGVGVGSPVSGSVTIGPGTANPGTGLYTSVDLAFIGAFHADANVVPLPPPGPVNRPGLGFWGGFGFGVGFIHATWVAGIKWF